MSGNYLYCQARITAIVGVSKQRLARLRKIKRKQTLESHGLTSKPSNRTARDVKAQFLQFVDASRAPNSCHAGSSSAEYYFDAAFTSFRPPARGSTSFDTKNRRSAVGSFNLSQEQAGEATCSAAVSRTWMKKERPSTAICPPKSDYCDLCKLYNEEISRAQTTMNRMPESSNAAAEAIQAQGT